MALRLRRKVRFAHGALPSANRQVRSWHSFLNPAVDDGIVVAVHFVYILRCATDVLYIGETADLDRRLEQHQDGSACSFTASRRPVALVYSEPHATRATALKRERQLKRWTRAKKEALIAGDVGLLKQL